MAAYQIHLQGHSRSAKWEQCAHVQTHANSHLTAADQPLEPVAGGPASDKPSKPVAVPSIAATSGRAAAASSGNDAAVAVKEEKVQGRTRGGVGGLGYFWRENKIEQAEDCSKEFQGS